MKPDEPGQFRVIASGLRFPEGPIALPQGDVLVVEIERGTLSRVAPDGRVSVVAVLGGGPNGAAMGPDGDCYVCNNGGFKWHHDADGMRPVGQSDAYAGGRIERVNLQTGRSEVLYRAIGERGLRGPNDIVFDRQGGFWFTDAGKARDREMDRGGIYYAKTDGSLIAEVVYPMFAPNGIALSANEDRLYVSETHTGRLWSFELDGPGKIHKKPFPSPNGGTLLAGLPGLQMMDSLAVDAAGNVCVAILFNGGIAVISPEGDVIRHVALPDVFTTNICFGGAGLKTAFVTLSQSGLLIALDWPDPGMPLNFLNA